MRSVADELRYQDREAVMRLSASDRVALALSLGERDAAALGKAHGLTRDEAVRAIERQRQAGRCPSACMRAIIG